MKNQTMQGRKTNRSVGRWLTALIVLMIVVLSGAMMIIGYLRFKKSTEEYYFRMGETTAGIVAAIIDPDSLDTYLDTLTTDKKYDDTMELLKKAHLECEAQALYVFRAAKDGITYIYDTDPSDMWCELGYYDPYTYIEDDGTVGYLYPDDTTQQLRKGGKVDTVMGITQYGWIITVSEPLYGSDGICKGYVGIDFDVNQVVAKQSAYLWQLAIIILIITALFAVIYLYIIQKAIILPINIMAKAADSFLVNSLEPSGKPDEQGSPPKSEKSIGASDILSMDINTGDEMQSLAESLKSMVRKIDEYITSLNIVTIKSETDVLTSLCNRGAFEQQVSAILRLRQDTDQINAFLMIDVDYFKAVNDNYGHAAGDMVLSECARALRRVVRESDIVGRLGGDEFAVFCKSIGSVAMAEQKARQIRDEWLKIIPPGGEKGITASIGISFTPQDGQVYQELFSKSDEALYRAKEAGRDGFALSNLS
ncbi:putative signaling protein [Treponema primitia ZAS-2]|uniref:Putative signaling protein n=1 Tax=Treponema primitia (strain ATCC BAA-887 / DSM 12427 / ZAS-2) TaxID=545694 RepID=F5YHZ6_TREPZ|nr:GGDEF domain-containing protein [Treponema primitia]AEF85021.1 putative signaling protein [Treponema primitia ZAS-2]